MKIPSAILLIFVAGALASCPGKKTNSKLICYYSKLREVDSCKCSHVVLPASSDVKSIDRIRVRLKGVKILITVNEFSQGLVDILKSSKVDGIEIGLKKLDSKNDISDFISTVRSKLGADLYIILSVPPKAETVAKYYDFKTLSRNADLFVLQTAFLGASKNVTFHPSRLSGLWDMQNTDSVVDLVSGLGAPLSKLVITSPVQAFRFKLQDGKFTAPGSPALEVQSLDRNELCRIMKNGGNWTLERDQDQAGPYIFSEDQWIAFDDATSIDIKAKYARVRGLAGMALKDLSQDGGTKCESSILDAAYIGLSRQARAPRGAVLHSLEREILETPARSLDTIQVSPYRISRIIDVEGNVHVIRQDTRTEFECSRQGYFVHPRSCGRFYRCVKFNQLSDEFSVFEFDCPAGLAFDSRVEVCVWPGSLPHASPCSGSSEIAPVPRERFVCPHEPGYYADPENCRWFFACLDHGRSPLSAYEFRCPFGLVYDESKLLCEWPWLVPKCASGYAVGSQVVYGGSGAIALDQYDGLGVLGVTALGGLHGPLQQPVAKIYSNVGTAGLLGSGQQNLLLHGNDGYGAGTVPLGTGQSILYGHDGYDGSHYFAGNGGLSIKAAQSLQNAGLLKSGYSDNSNLQEGVVSGLAYTPGHAGNVGSFGLKLGQSGGSRLAYTQGQDTLLNTVYQDSGFDTKSQQSFVHGANANVNSGLAYTANTDSSFGVRGSSGTAIAGGQSEGFGANLHLISGGATTGTLVGGGQVSGATVFDGQSEGFGTNLHLGSGDAATGRGQVKGATAFNEQSGEFGANLHLINGGAAVTGTNLVGAGQVHSASVLDGQSEEYGANLRLLNGGGKTGQVKSVNLVDGHSEGFGANLRLVSGGAAIGSSLVGAGQVKGAVILDQSEGFGANLHLISGGGADAGQIDSQSGRFGAKLHLVSGGTGQVKDDSSGAHLINNLAYDNSAAFGAKSQQSFSQYHGQSGVVLTGQTLAQGAEVSGYDNTKASVKYHGNTGSSFASGTSGNINIIGGGYSAVGVANSGIEITNYGDNSNTISHVTPSPISVTTVSSIPTVTSVPVPALKVASGFQSYKGGVVANIPQLQYKVRKPVSNVFYQSNLATARGGSGFVNISSNFVNTISSTPSTITVAGGYHYPKPTVAFVEEPVKTTLYQQPLVTSSVVQQNIASVQPVVISTTQTPLVVEKVQPVVTNYQKPVSFVQQHVSSVQPIVTTYQKPYQIPLIVDKVNVQPVVVSTNQTPLVVENVNVQPAVSTYNVQKEDTSFVGYDYPKPAVAFEEIPVKAGGASFSYQNLNTAHRSQNHAAAASFSHSASSTVKPVTVVEQVQPVVTTYQKPAVSTTSFVQQHVQPIVTTYQKPVIVSTTQTPLVVEKVNIQPAVSTYNVQKEDTSFVGYDYPKPAVAFEEIPVKAGGASFSYQNLNTAHRSQNHAAAASFSYSASSTVKPVTVVEQVQPVVTTYQKPAVSTTSFVQQHVQPIVTTYQKPVIVSTTQTPLVVEKVNIQPAVSTYNVQKEDTGFVGYNYPKPAVAFEETPVQTGGASFSYQNLNAAHRSQNQAALASFSYSAPSTVKPVTVVEQIQPVVQVQPTVQVTPQVYVSSTPAPIIEQKVVEPAVVSSFSISSNSGGYQYQKPSVVTYEQPAVSTYYQTPVQPAISRYNYKNVVQSVLTQGYSSPKPAVAFKEAPAVVSSFSFTAPSTVKPAVVVQKQKSVVTAKPAVVTSYSYSAPSTVKPAVIFEQPVVSHIPSSTPRPQVLVQRQPAVVSSYSYSAGSTARPAAAIDFAGYNYPKTAVSFVEESSPVVSYENREPVKEELFVAKKAYVTGSQSTSYQQQFNNAAAVQVQQKPLVVENYQAPVVSTTPLYEYKQQYSSVDSGYVYDKPAIPFEENYQAPIQVVNSTPRTIIDYSYVQSTPRPTFASTVAAVVSAKQPIEQRPFRFYDSRLVSTARPVSYSTTLPVVASVTTSRPISKYSFSSFDNQYKVAVSAPLPSAKVVEDYVAPISVTTSAPLDAYVVPEVGNYGIKVTTSSPIEVTPSSEYLPARARVKVTTTAPTEEYLVPEVTTPRARVRVTTPSTAYLPVKTVRPSTIVKVNDFHPLLSAKLGAQCTCVSNSLKLAKKKLKIVVEDDDDDGYVVDNNENGNVVENYQYEPQKIVQITPTPEVYIKSTPNELIEPSPTPGYAVRKRVRVRPVTSTAYPVTNAAELFVKAITPVTVVQPTLSAEANLVPIAGGASAALQGKNFDRYGPGGWRSRNERLQGTIDCQRAGLFRHPTQCNKFYACRWDCTKNRYTLHVFNCPVHLTFDNNLGACNWPSQGPACLENTLLPSD